MSSAEIWQHSVPVDINYARTKGCITTLPIRISAHDKVANEANARAVQDWDAFLDDGFAQKYGFRSGFSPGVGNWASFIFPESTPERLYIVAYLADMGCMHDDVCEELDYDEAVQEHEFLSQALNVVRDGSYQDQATKKATDRSRQMTKYMSRCLLDAMKIDRPRAIKMLDRYRKEWLDGSERERDTMDTVETIEEYYLQRGLNGGMGAFWALVQFGMGIDISADEDASIEAIYDSATRALLLSNDYYSWEREWYDAQLKKDNRNLWNAIYHWMRTKGSTIDEAKKELVRTIQEEEQRYLLERDAYFAAHPDCPLYLRRYIEVIGSITAGNSLWAATCPRNYVGPWYPGSEERYFKEHGVLVGSIASAAGSSVANEDAETDKSSSTSVTDAASSVRSISTAGSSVGEAKLEAPNHVGEPLVDPLHAPIKYIMDMPSKGLRHSFTDSINQWIKLEEATVRQISHIINLLHNSSLLLDDIEDNSPLRRGLPATHEVFGPAQTINSANFMFVEAVTAARLLPHPASADVLLEELSHIFAGQSWDLYWKFHVKVPTEAEFLEMVDRKTGVMFRLLMRLMLLQRNKGADAAEVEKEALPALARLAQPFGRMFQIRDDFMNLYSADYANQKGTCEDLDEGKISYPVLRMLHGQSQYQKDQVIGIFQKHAAARASAQTVGHATPMAKETKAYVLKLLNQSGAMQETLEKLSLLEDEVEKAILAVEEWFDDSNEVLRLLISTLSIKDLVLNNIV